MKIAYLIPIVLVLAAGWLFFQLKKMKGKPWPKFPGLARPSGTEGPPPGAPRHVEPWRLGKITRDDLLKPSVLALIAANLIPLYGVLFLRWQVFPLIFLYWLENAFIGAFNVLKMVMTPPYDAKTWMGKAFLVPFFCVHYGLFTAVHGVFVMVLFGGFGLQGSRFPSPALVIDSLKQRGLVFPALVLFLSHAFSFVWNYVGNKEYERAGFQELMGRPYARVVVLHLTLLLGGFLLMGLGSPVFGLLLFVFLKIAFDLRAHLKEHAPQPHRSAPKTAPF